MNFRERLYPKRKHDEEMEQKMQEKAKQQDWAEYKYLSSLYKEMFLGK